MMFSNPGIVTKSPMRNDEWSELLQRLAKSEDEAAFVQLFRHFAPLIKGFCLSNGSSRTPEAADELVQEIMCKVWRKAGKFDPSKSSASTWIYTIARNTQIDFLRKHADINALTGPLEADDIWDEANIDNSSAVVYLQQALDQRDLAVLLDGLPREQSECLFKVYLEGKSHADLADELNLPLGTVKSRIRLGLQRLKSVVKL